ncbi:hypothetical protein Bca101_040587 [Brassica carinata]
MISMAQLKGVWVEAAEENHEDFNEGIIQVQGKKKASFIKIGKILTHRENNDGRQLIYEKLPKDIASLDHVLASVNALSLLISKGVPESQIIFLKHQPNKTFVYFSSLKHLKGFMRSQETSNEDSGVIPGLGEFTDCYFAKNEGRSGTLTVSQDKERIYGAKDMVKIYDDPCYNIQKK